MRTREHAHEGYIIPRREGDDSSYSLNGAISTKVHKHTHSCCVLNYSTSGTQAGCSEFLRHGFAPSAFSLYGVEHQTTDAPIAILDGDLRVKPAEGVNE